jgi:hypothetical protein
MGTFTDEMRMAVAAANAYISRKVKRDLEAGHSVTFMAEGRYFERTREGDFELVEVDGRLVRPDEAALAADASPSQDASGPSAEHRL